MLQRLSDGSFEQLGQVWRNKIGMHKADPGQLNGGPTVKYVSMAVETKLVFRGFQTPTVMKDAYDKFEAFVAAMNGGAEAPASCNKALQTCDGAQSPK